MPQSSSFQEIKMCEKLNITGFKYGLNILNKTQMLSITYILYIKWI